MAVWSLIEEKPYGILTHHLKRHWLSVISTLAPSEVKEIHSRMPPPVASEIEAMVEF